ncbi:MAG: xanthine dehydrogenase family protein molybdopterin-binding subunit [Proteobacteria bacterium]|jgi:carbon-monoxide dehydrogenase large subunit|nr:xanthine dehydrogenase family protein molybdopterin-binding subunit [Pseudomonadota bacterium]MDA0959343.1 xanthine dehydrogenase family protein molybdopterin-binding subunit [Pseudomonadota bacterium]MDA1151333.1 xanthine dehydrogenase family protein molybdopterin-binding subunit [Pseudomonadota bacterium]HAE09502.1 aldehyde oxidase [Alphaproteobacteria bacterium]
MNDQTGPAFKGRVEDIRFVSGHGRFTADIVPDNALHAVFLRSNVAAGVITSLDCSAAKTAPGVVSVLTALDAAADGVANMVWTGGPVREDGGVTVDSPRPLLSGKEIRHLGEPVAMVIADTRQAAADAAELIEVQIDAADAVALSVEHMLGGPLVWPGTNDNIASLHRQGNRDEVDAILAKSAHVSHFAFDISKITACTMEMRASIGFIDENGKSSLTTSAQSPYQLHGELAQLFGISPDEVRVTSPDVGGSFGMKGALYREDALVVWAARRLGRPVFWTADRGEAFLSDEHARAVSGTASLGLDAEGNFTALWVDARIDAGAYLSRRTKGLLNNMGGVAGQYKTPAIATQMSFFFTNTMQTSPYRGFGRPEATYVIERLIDQAARETGRDALALRQQNLVTPEAMPYQTALTFLYDCGDFPKIVAAAAKNADYAGFAARRKASEARGMLRGIGISNPIEVAGGPLKQVRKDIARITARPDGQIVVTPGLMSVGQGHETALARMASQRLGVDIDDIIYQQGDTDLLPSGRGSGGSAATVIGGAAVHVALNEFVAAGKGIAAGVLGCDADQITFDAGLFSNPAEPARPPMSWADIASHSNEAGGMSVLGEFLPPDVTYPNGCHICEVEIDPATGKVSFADYVVVEDVGTVLNADLVEGQMHGGIAQGVGQALGEILHFDESGQLITGSFMDYQMPIAADFPNFRISTIAVPTKINPLGAKGVGEAGTVGALAATMNAIVDAMACAGVAAFEMPATPHRVWQALQDAKKSAS